MDNIPSPAIAIVGRHNSGKTTFIEGLIAKLVSKGLDVGSIKHHTHGDFQIDYPGKDSYRHKAAGATETVIASPTKIARVKTIDHEVECSEIVKTMSGHDIIIVEGYRKSGLATIELMRSGNDADLKAARAFLESAQAAESGEEAQMPAEDDGMKVPGESTVAVISDIPEAMQAAEILGIPCFDLGDEGISQVADFLDEKYVRPRITVVIQAGGESRRMGQSKALVEFRGRPLICNILERISPVADQVVITTNEPELLEFLFDEYPNVNLKLSRDLYDFRGALPGLCTAMDSSDNPYVAIVACDMVFASAALIMAEAIEMKATGASVVVPVNAHGFEPFHAMYRKDVCLPAIQDAISQGKRRAQDLFDADEVTVVRFPHCRVLEVEPFGGCFINVNTPEDLRRVQETFIKE